MLFQLPPPDSWSGIQPDKTEQLYLTARSNRICQRTIIFKFRHT